MPATAEPTLTYTLDANTIRDSAVSRRSFDPFRSPGARFDFMGRLPSGFGRSLKTVPEIDSTIGGTSTTRGNGSRGVSGPPVVGSAARRNVKVIRPRPLFLLPSWTG